MKIPRLWRAAGATALLALALGTFADPAAAQIEMAVYGTAEADTEEMSLLLLGLAVQPAGLGFKPVATVNGYRLSYPGAGGTETLAAINPAAGVRYQWPVGAVQATAGYLFLSNQDGEGFGAPGGAEQGFTAALMGDFWDAGARSGQVIGSYNFGDHYFWGRARGAQQIATLAGGPLRLGAEVVGQGEDLLEQEEDLTGVNYRSFQAGPILEYGASPNLQLLAGAGVKSDNLPDNADLFPYFKVEFVFLP